MPDRTIRTIGASVVLVALVVAGAFQLGAKEDPAPVEIAVEDPTTTTSREQASESDPRPTTTTPEPFVYRVGVLSGISTDNFWAYFGKEASVWNSYILGPTKLALYSLDDATGELSPELIAEEVTPVWDSDGWRVRVELSPDYRWSDGEPVTAEDFVFTFETVRRLGLGGSWAEAFPASVESVHADREHDLRIEFSEKPNLTVWPFGVGLAPVMAEHIWVDAVGPVDEASGLYELAGADDVGGGPLTLSATTSELVVGSVNPGYPDAETPDRVEYHVFADEAALVEALAAGVIDAMVTPNGVTEEQASTLAADPNVTILTSPANGVRYLGFNLARAPMSDQALRTALALLLDKEAVAEQIAQTGEPTWSMLPRTNSQWYDDTQAEANRTRYSGELADRLGRAVDGLIAAGYAWSTPPALADDGSVVGGEGLTIDGQNPQPLTILTSGDAYDPARPDYVAHIAATLSLLGFDVRPVETDFDSVVDLAFTPDKDGAFQYDMYLLGWTLGNPAHPSFYRPFFAPDGEMNNTGYSSEALNQALTDYETAATLSEAREALWEMEHILSADLPYLVLYNSQLVEAYRSDRVAFGIGESLGGIQGRLGGLGDVRPAG